MLKSKNSDNTESNTVNPFLSMLISLQNPKHEKPRHKVTLRLQDVTRTPRGDSENAPSYLKILKDCTSVRFPEITPPPLLPAFA